MRVLVTGQVGLDKKEYLNQVAQIARQHGENLKIFHLGDMMYREAPDVPPGRILDLPLARLNSLRRAVMRDVLAEAPKHKHVLVNTHATFRWRHGLFSAFDFDQLAQFAADLYITLVDNIESVHQRMLRDHELEHSLKDLMVWREEEILATETLAKAANAFNTTESAGREPGGSGVGGESRGSVGGAGSEGGPAKFYVISRGRNQMTSATLFRMIFRPTMKKVYPSFPMSHVMDMPATLAEIDAFRAQMAERFITFDPGDVDEKVLADKAVQAVRDGQQILPLTVNGVEMQFKVRELLDITGDIDGQIYARDFILVRQADMIVSYIPELPTGKPGLSSGVERELQHAYEHGRDVFVIWKPRKDPSPFITQTATKVFHSVEEALKHFEERGFFTPHDLFGS
ncbi:MAG: AAA family ATPase [Phycisphaerae bacterium]